MLCELKSPYPPGLYPDPELSISVKLDVVVTSDIYTTVVPEFPGVQ